MILHFNNLMHVHNTVSGEDNTTEQPHQSGVKTEQLRWAWWRWKVRFINYVYAHVSPHSTHVWRTAKLSDQTHKHHNATQPVQNGLITNYELNPNTKAAPKGQYRSGPGWESKQSSARKLGKDTPISFCKNIQCSYTRVVMPPPFQLPPRTFCLHECRMLDGLP